VLRATFGCVLDKKMMARLKPYKGIFFADMLPVAFFQNISILPINNQEIPGFLLRKT
jgi:hypothetical protein